MRIGDAVRGMPTLQRVVKRHAPFGEAFMGLFWRHRLPSHSAMSRFLAALTPECVQVLRQVFGRPSIGCGRTADTRGGLSGTHTRPRVAQRGCLGARI